MDWWIGLWILGGFRIGAQLHVGVGCGQVCWTWALIWIKVDWGGCWQINFWLQIGVDHGESYGLGVEGVG